MYMQNFNGYIHTCWKTGTWNVKNEMGGCVHVAQSTAQQRAMLLKGQDLRHVRAVFMASIAVIVAEPILRLKDLARFAEIWMIYAPSINFWST